TLGGADSFREPIILEAEEYIGVKSFKARGKRITTFAVDKVEELEPTRQPEPQTPEEDTERTASPADEPDPYEGKSQADVADEMTGQMHLFDD
ncbi:MAG: DNA gyrase/topoisomerase IV subunit A, partial [Bacteroidaceae bacterium]|nr:DNA gyrase/topoisomerase IV subunit A [Bacteroidaceae bacterium]